MPGNDPDFLIIGAQKSGTSSLHYYLNQHLNLVGSKPKEVHYFERYINYPNKNLNWYKNHFKALSSKDKLFFEASPNYIYHEAAAIRIKENYPDIKLILILRDPVHRAFSAWNMYHDYYKTGVAKKKLRYGRYPNTENEVYLHLFKGRSVFPTFRETVNLELKLMQDGVYKEPSILRRGLYLEQIKNYLKYFKRSQLLILGFRELVREPLSVCNTVLDFVGLKGRNMQHLTLEIKNKRSYDFQLQEEDKKFLTEFYAESNLQLFTFLERDLDW